MIYNNFYKHNHLYDSPIRQVAFLFDSIANLIEEAENHRKNKEFEAFCYTFQKVMALLDGLSGWINIEIASQKSKSEQTISDNIKLEKKSNEFVVNKAVDTPETEKWDAYFKNILLATNKLVLDENPEIYKALLENLRSMAINFKTAANQISIQDEEAVKSNYNLNQNTDNFFEMA
jgi:hypothetical protein